MKLTKVLLLFVAVFGGVCLMGGCLLYRGYNRVIQFDEEVKAGWAEVENQLQRRFDLIPNVMETVKGFAGQEEKILLGVAEARKAYFGAGSIAEKASAATTFHSTLMPMMRLQETYPDLKSNENFMRLQDELSGTENRLGVSRMRYNEKVKSLNSYIRGLAGKFYAGLADVEKAEYFEISEATKEVPKIDFSG